MVEWKKLGDVCNVYDGTHQTPKYTDCGIKFVSVENIHAPYNSNKYISEDDYIKKYKTKPQQGDVLMTRIGDIGTCTVLNREEPIAYYVSLALLRPNQDLVQSNYVKYILESNTGKKELRKKTLLTAVPLKINLGDVGKISIPIPSLSEQSRIVSILDTFTSSISNLKQQIEERRKQYEYERNLLLDLEGKEGVEMKKLGEVVSSDCSLSYGIVQPGDDVADGVPVVRPVDLISNYVKLDGLKKTERLISESYKRTILKGNEILFCVRGTTGIMGLATNELKGCNVTRGIVPISFDDEITKMFVYYQLKCFRLQKVIDEKTNGTALKQINIKDLRLLNLFFPPLSTQSRIVSILDTFEQSISNLEEQLAMREKQYEYYRNQLLTFEGEEERGKT